MFKVDILLFGDQGAGKKTFISKLRDDNPGCNYETTRTVSRNKNFAY